ncbi:Scr1 family TA system antitoxin-like transcriptional regulator [Micromonospora sp. NPDC049523]|uniref:Scr1 family TA system antitoxin-like transcriptional regulator n=1 Tax=Micromonospora sp. NPDC049523 TaxID=3155921 RepID=UPI00342331C5
MATALPPSCRNKGLHLDNQLHARVVSHHEDVATLQEAWERIRSEALTHRQSINLIKEVAQTWS